MTPETWAGLTAGCLLALSAAARGFALINRSRGGNLIAIAARLGGMIALAAAIASTCVGVRFPRPLVETFGHGVPLSFGPTALAMALAAMVLYQLLVSLSRVDGASPAIDLLAAALVLLGTFAGTTLSHGRPSLTCYQRAIPLYSQWILLLVGAGGVLIAGSAGIMTTIQSLGSGRGRNPILSHQLSPSITLHQATRLSLTALGSGLAVGTWWAWRVTGHLTSGDPREAWAAVTWLVTTMSLVAWRVGKRTPWRSTLAATLSILAVASVIFGFLAAA